MKHIVSKNKHGYCGVATLINLFRDENMLQYLDMNDCYAIGDIGLNKILTSEGYGSRLINMVTVFGDEKIPNSFVKQMLTSREFDPSKSDFKHPIVIFSLTVQLGHEEETFHAIGIIRHGDRYFLSDPRYDEYVELDKIDDLFSIIKHVSNISAIGLIEDDTEKIAFIDADKWGFSELIIN